MTERPTDLGQVAYDAYLRATGGVSAVTLAVLPDWDGQGENVRVAWRAAATAVADYLARGQTR